MAARGEFFRNYHLPVLSAEQNDSQSEDINVIDESQAENRPVPVQEAEIRWKKVPFFGRYVCYVMLNGRSNDNVTRAAHSLFRLGELHVKAGYVSILLAG